MIDSSPSSAESCCFRDLDEAFLQTQTRIWLGEVLNTRLDDSLPISDLLQDGEILFEVSKEVWNLLVTKCIELRHLKHKYGPFGSKKSSGRYRPYSNVDSFLKTCKILGLSGIDLFSPSDVVEKRDVWKVCICIRALSKKARSKQLSVPDFDVVICSVAMPTDMVGVIRRSIESSQCTLSSSSSCISRKTSQTKPVQKKFYVPYDRDGDYSSSDESDEAESRYMGENSFSSVSKLDYGDGINSDLESSPEEYPISGQYKKQNVLESDVQKKVHHSVDNINFIVENNDSVVGDSSCTNIGENNYISDYLAFSDLMVHATDGSNNPVVLDGENNMFDFFLNVDSQGLTSDRKRSFLGGSHRKFSDDEEMEVSSTTSMSSVLGRLLNLEFNEHFDEDDSSSANVYSSASKESEKHYKDSFVLSESPTTDTFEDAQSEIAPRVFNASTEYLLLSEDKSDLYDVGFLEGESCGTQISSTENVDIFLENRDFVITDDNQETLIRTTMLDSTGFGSHISDVTFEYLTSKPDEKINFQGYRIEDTPPVVSDDTNICSSIVQANLHETMSESNHPLLVNGMNKAQEDNTSSVAENGIQDKTEDDMVTLTRSISERALDESPRQPRGKHNRRPLLKTVVKGTAIAGVLLLLLHIGRGKGNNEQETKHHVEKHSKLKPSWIEQQQKRRVGKGIYPSEKLKL